MLNEDLCSLLQCLLRHDGTVCSNLHDQLLIVGLLLHAIILHGVFHILDRSVDRVNRNLVEIGSGKEFPVFISGNPSATFVDCEIHLETCRCVETTNHQFWIEHLETGKNLTQIACSEHIRARYAYRTFLGLVVFCELLETNLLEVKNDVCHILLHSGNRVELVSHSLDADGTDGETSERRQKNATQGVADSLSISRLERTEFKFSEGVARFKHDHLIGFLKC